MTQYIFPVPPVSAAPIRGSEALFPIYRIFCVGRNYAAHAKEMGAVPDREAPFYFTKSSRAYAPSGATVPFAAGTDNLHYEVELVVAIGKAAFRIAADQALDHVFGYGCGLDMTRRDLQQGMKDKRLSWDIGKDFEDSAVLSEIVPAAVCGHPAAAGIGLKLNGEMRQSSNTSDMIHSIPALISHLSTYYHLQPGDLIYTGTPEGVGAVKPGDRIDGWIDGVATIALTMGAPD